MNNSDCAILVPIGSHLEPETEAGLRVLVDRGYVVRTLRGTADVVLARCSLATEALRDGFKETMWIDSDIDFIPDDVDKIREQGPFVAGLYLQKKKAQSFAAKFKADTGGVFFGPNGGLIEMQGVGMGFTYIRAEVYESIADHFGMKEVDGGYDGKTVVPYFLPMLTDDWRESFVTYLAEDFSFSHRATLSGYRPMADTRIDLGHWGRHCYSLRDSNSQPAEKKMNEEQLLARIGRMQLVSEQQDHAYSQLLNLLAGVVSGDTDRSRVMVNLTDRTWAIAAQGERPALPATINGLPVCVVAQEQPAEAQT